MNIIFKLILKQPDGRSQTFKMKWTWGSTKKLWIKTNSYFHCLICYWEIKDQSSKTVILLTTSSHPWPSSLNSTINTIAGSWSKS